MKLFLKVFLYVIIILVILGTALAAYVWFKNPLGLRGVIENKIAPQLVEIDESYDHPLLNSDQEKQLRDIGIDPAKLPTEVTVEQQKCVEDKLGSYRVKELLEGGSPSMGEVLKAASCL